MKLLRLAPVIFCLASPATPAADVLTPAGTWSGKALFTSSVLGTDDPAFTGTFDLSISITVYGEVTGAVPENQCVFSGRAVPLAPGSSAAKLNITISGCANPGYNARYDGTLSPTRVDKAQFQLTSMTFDRALSNAARRNVISSSLTR